ncbi:MAG: extracellular solute-binding protein [Anaerolineales bacterium]|jgi:ABC-type glycerol-3-phosphate transport system substrate-binding protein
MRLTRLLALSLLAFLAFAACGPVTPLPSVTLSLPAVTSRPTIAPTLTPSPTPLPTLGVDPASLRGLSLQVWQALAGPANDLFARQAAQFTAENEWGITVNPIGYGDYSSLFDAVNTALDSDQPPDLVVALPEQTLAWEANGAVVDLNPYLGDPQWGLPAGDKADIPSIFLAQDNVNGKQLGLPAQRSAHFVFYNQTWAHELGFDNPPATAEDFRRQACAANASFLLDKDLTNDAKGGWVVDTDWQTTYSWLLAFGGGVTHASDYDFHTDSNLAALQFIKGLSDSHCAWPSETPYDSFASRTALFISGDLSELPAEMEAMTRLKNSDAWTVIPFPGSQGSVLVTYGPSYTVLKSTPAKDLAAWLFARWLLSPENQSQWVEETGLFPLRNSVLGMIQPYRQASPQWDAAVGYLSLAQDVPQLASWRKVRYVLEDGMDVLFLENLSVDKLPSVLDEMDSMAQEVK